MPVSLKPIPLSRAVSAMNKGATLTPIPSPFYSGGLVYTHVLTTRGGVSYRVNKSIAAAVTSERHGKDKYGLYELDFTGVNGNEHVKAQGVTLCIKTAAKGYFSLDLERYPTRQDLAKKTFVANLNMKIARRIAEKRKTESDDVRRDG